MEKKKNRFSLLAQCWKPLSSD